VHIAGRSNALRRFSARAESAINTCIARSAGRYPRQIGFEAAGSRSPVVVTGAGVMKNTFAWPARRIVTNARACCAIIVCPEGEERSMIRLPAASCGYGGQ
jgi:hypothetical protein